ncbi:MAG: M61 family peptidase [Planctomycetota bacterium]|nr:MAG: M61 family peptidase [Planctomycetota bacterium]
MDLTQPLLALATLLCLAAPAPGQHGLRLPARASEPRMIRYDVSLAEHHAHRLTVSMSLQDLSGDALELSMPVWTPGSYLVREYARHVIELSAATPDGRELAVEKTAKDSWRVATDGASAVTVSYLLYANEVSVRTSHVDADHAYLHPAGSFLRHGPSADGPHQVQITAPDGWRVFSSLDGEGGTLTAGDYDELMDSPIEVGPHDELRFELRGVPHTIVLAGRSDVDHDSMRDDVAAICEQVADVFGQMPFERYVFIMALVDSGGGGLEHKDSSVCMYNRWSISSKSGWRRFLGLVGHEYFHAWNVKRFRPVALGPFDYAVENYTPDLWVAEGITSYYDDLFVLRAGFDESVGAYLKARAQAFQKEADRPGGERMSLERASLDAWIKHYRPDENSSNVAISYYTKGALVALTLDLAIRRLTTGEASLADALRLGWRRYTEQGVGFPPGAMQALVEEVTGHDLNPYFEDYIRGTADVDPNPDLAWVGLTLEVSPQSTERTLPEDDDGFALEPWLGISTRRSGELTLVDLVREDGPAFAAGLNHDDVLLAVDDLRVSSSTLQERLDRRAGKGPITLTFFRGQSLRTLELQPQARRLERWRLVSVEHPSEQQLAAFKLWTGHEHPEADEGAADEALDGD